MARSTSLEKSLGLWDPLPELIPQSGDLSLIFMSFGLLRFGSEVNDRLYSAHKPQKYFDPMIPGVEQTGFVTDYPAKAVACDTKAEQAVASQVLAIVCMQQILA